MGMPIERLLQLRAFEPLRDLRRYLGNHPELSPDAAAAALVAVDESFLASDYEAALELHQMLDPMLIFADFTGDLRIAISRVVVTARPQWAKRVFLGRLRFLSELQEIDAEVRRCFRQAGLFAEDPPDDVVEWWACLNHEMRGFLNFDNAVQGRIAEQRSLELEREKLKQLGISSTPKWQSIDDNTLGYDILSYRPGGEFPSNLLIEVKSSSRNPPAVIISRKEWAKAKEAKDKYIFHVWHVKDGKPHTLYEWSYDMIVAHMPSDNGDGEWMDVIVPINAVKKASA